MEEGKYTVECECRAIKGGKRRNGGGLGMSSTTTARSVEAQANFAHLEESGKNFWT